MGVGAAGVFSPLGCGPGTKQDRAGLGLQAFPEPLLALGPVAGGAQGAMGQSFCCECWSTFWNCGGDLVPGESPRYGRETGMGSKVSERVGWPHGLSAVAGGRGAFRQTCRWTGRCVLG